MKAIYKYPIKDSKETVLVEIETEGGQMVRASRAGEAAKSATGNLDGAFAKFEPMIPALSTVLKVFSTAGKSAEIAFGIRLMTDGDALVTSGQNEANFIVMVHQQS
jgi:hypothetical protein